MKKCLSILFCFTLVLAFFSGAAAAEESSLFSDRDLSQEADLSGAEVITLSGQSVTIDHAGIFVLSGSIGNGQILVAAGDEDKVQLMLGGVDIHTEAGAAIQVITADKVFLTLAQGSENILSSNGILEDGTDGVIYSKADLGRAPSPSLPRRATALCVRTPWPSPEATTPSRQQATASPARTA